MAQTSIRTRRQKRRVWLRDAGRCRFCLKYLTIVDATRDHVVPKSVGGNLNDYNVVTCCLDCNAAKANNIPDFWMILWLLTTGQLLDGPERPDKDDPWLEWLSLQYHLLHPLKHPWEVDEVVYTDEDDLDFDFILE
jgi:hypothetical protein